MTLNKLPYGLVLLLLVGMGLHHSLSRKVQQLQPVPQKHQQQGMPLLLLLKWGQWWCHALAAAPPAPAPAPALL